MGTSVNNEKMFHDKIVDFADTLSPEEKKKLLFILGTYSATVSNKDTVKILFGEDSGYLEEIDSAPESDGEIRAFGTVKATKPIYDYVTKSSKRCVDTVVDTVVSAVTNHVLSKVTGCEGSKPKPIKKPEPEPTQEPTKPKKPTSAEGPGDHVIP